MCPFESFQGGFFPCVLVPAVCQHVKELHGGLSPYFIPGAAQGFRGAVYIRNPPPTCAKSVFAIRIFAFSASRFAGLLVFGRAFSK